MSSSDVAISAPFGDGTGTVFIYHSSSTNLLNPIPQQVSVYCVLYRQKLSLVKTFANRRNIRSISQKTFADYQLEMLAGSYIWSDCMYMGVCVFFSTVLYFCTV